MYHTNIIKYSLFYLALKIFKYFPLNINNFNWVKREIRGTQKIHKKKYERPLCRLKLLVQKFKKGYYFELTKKCLKF